MTTEYDNPGLVLDVFFTRKRLLQWMSYFHLAWLVSIGALPDRIMYMIELLSGGGPFI